MACLKLASYLMCFLITFVELEGLVYVESDSNKFFKKPLDSIALTVGRSYRIRNKRSNLYMSEVSITQNRPHSIEQWPLVTDKHRDSQVWFLVPMENDRFRIANKRTGHSLITAGSSLANSAYTHQASLTFLPSVAETWIIQRDTTITNEGLYYTIQNELSKLYLVIEGFSTTTAARVQQYPMQVDANRDSLQWAFEVEKEYPKVDKANQKVNRKVEDIGDVQRITSWQQPIPSKTEDVLIGQLAIPFPLIVEPTFSLSQQSMLSPYYFLRRYGYWNMVAYHEHSGTSQIAMSTPVNLGLITDNANEIEKVMGLAVSSESSLGLKALGTKLIKSNICNGLKINVDEEPNDASNKTMELERKFVTLNRVIDAAWFREDRYVLERMNGDKVLEWITRVPVTKSDGYRGHQTAFSNNNVGN